MAKDFCILTDNPEICVKMMEEQVKTEMAMRNLGEARYLKNHERQSLEDTSAGRNLIRSCLEPMAAAIEDQRQLTGKAMRRAIAARKLREISADRAAFVTLRVLLSMGSEDKIALMKVAATLGRAIEDELRIDKFEQEDVCLL